MKYGVYYKNDYYRVVEMLPDAPILEILVPCDSKQDAELKANHMNRKCGGKMKGCLFHGSKPRRGR